MKYIAMASWAKQDGPEIDARVVEADDPDLAEEAMREWVAGSFDVDPDDITVYAIGRDWIDQDENRMEKS
jgi:hypothetical protein